VSRDWQVRKTPELSTRLMIERASASLAERRLARQEKDVLMNAASGESGMVCATAFAPVVSATPAPIPRKNATAKRNPQNCHAPPMFPSAMAASSAGIATESSAAMKPANGRRGMVMRQSGGRVGLRNRMALETL